MLDSGGDDWVVCWRFEDRGPWYCSVGGRLSNRDGANRARDAASRECRTIRHSVGRLSDMLEVTGDALEFAPQVREKKGGLA